MRIVLVCLASVLAACASTEQAPAPTEPAPTRDLKQAPEPEPPPREPPPPPEPEPTPTRVPVPGPEPLPPQEVPVRPAPAGDSVERAVILFKEYLKTNPDSMGLKNQIAHLALRKDPAVVEPLMTILRNPKYDDTVQIAVCQAVGEQGVKSVAVILMAMIDSRLWEDKPKLIAAALEGVGDADAAGQYKEILKLAKKYLDINGDIASAAYRAAAVKVDRETVDDLIKELTRASFIRDEDSDRKKAARTATRPVLVELLQKMTGAPIEDVKVWNEWWNDNKKTWKPGRVVSPVRDVPKESDGPEVLSDEARGIEIRRPTRAWSLRGSRRPGPCIVLETLQDGRRAAWVEVFAEQTRTFLEKTPEEWARVVRGQLAGEFQPAATSEWEKPCSYAGMRGVEQVLSGRHRDHGLVRMRNVFLEKGGVMYYFLSTCKDGSPAHLDGDIEAILGNFRLTR